MDLLVEILKKEFEKRKAKNSSYSLRRFSQILEIDSSNLTKIMNYKKSIGKSTAQKICEKLNLSSELLSGQKVSLENGPLSKLFFVNEAKDDQYYSFYIDGGKSDLVSEKIDQFLSELETHFVDPATSPSTVKISIIKGTKT
jgi:DNA-binding Xre family transcriptional regulator